MEGGSAHCKLLQNLQEAYQVRRLITICITSATAGQTRKLLMASSASRRWLFFAVPTPGYIWTTDFTDGRLHYAIRTKMAKPTDQFHFTREISAQSMEYLTGSHLCWSIRRPTVRTCFRSRLPGRSDALQELDAADRREFTAFVAKSAKLIVVGLEAATSSENHCH
jgi:hypothetical protein